MLEGLEMFLLEEIKPVFTPNEVPTIDKVLVVWEEKNKISSQIAITLDPSAPPPYPGDPIELQCSSNVGGKDIAIFNDDGLPDPVCDNGLNGKYFLIRNFFKKLIF